MNNKERASIAATVKNKKYSKISTDIYLENPNKCLSCGNNILPDGIHFLSEIKKKKFCNQSCSANYNNTRRNKIVHKCKCGNLVTRRGNSCKSCAKSDKEFVPYMTKNQLINNRNGYQSWRSSVSKNAVRVYKRSKKPLVCFVCGYKKGIDICHIRPVSSFHNTALISEINAISNLVALCPNHHWEFDHNIIDISFTE